MQSAEAERQLKDRIHSSRAQRYTGGPFYIRQVPLLAKSLE